MELIILDSYDRSYNNKMDIYLEAFSYYSKNKIFINGSIGKNDCFDINHFLYLYDNVNDKIVTNDNLIINICKNCFTNKLFKPDGYNSII